MLDIKHITDIKLSEYIGVKDTKTLRNWKKLENPNFIPAIGKHNLYNAAKMYMYLFAFEDKGKDESELNNNFELLYSSFETLEENLKLDTSKLTKEVKEAVINSNNTALNNIRSILEEMNKVF